MAVASTCGWRQLTFYFYRPKTLHLGRSFGACHYLEKENISVVPSSLPLASSAATTFTAILVPTLSLLAFLLPESISLLLLPVKTGDELLDVGNTIAAGVVVATVRQAGSQLRGHVPKREAQIRENPTSFTKCEESRCKLAPAVRRLTTRTSTISDTDLGK